MTTSQELVARCRARNLKITPQRLAVFKALEKNTSHPSAEAVFCRVRRTHPTVSFSTIYKTLETLRDLGEIRELELVPGHKSWDPNTQPHHHLICQRCHRIQDLEEDFSAHLRLPRAVGRSFRVTGHAVNFFGLCQTCQERGS